jgi:hypothetical protein
MQGSKLKHWFQISEAPTDRYSTCAAKQQAAKKLQVARQKLPGPGPRPGARGGGVSRGALGPALLCSATLRLCRVLGVSLGGLVHAMSCRNSFKTSSKCEVSLPRSAVYSRVTALLRQCHRGVT